ncbi:MAG: hypothetical protein Q9160_001278 [Pyrenula sp. 1 TL-2023]
MAAIKPTFVIVPGAWHPISCYNGLSKELSSAGYPVEFVKLPSLDPSDPFDASCARDADVVRETLLPLIEAGKNVVVVPHSYGGIPAGCGARGLAASAREKEGKKGGVLGLIYMTSFVVPEGSTLLEFMGGKHPPYVQENSPSEGLSSIEPTRETIYNDLSESSAEALEKTLRPHALKAFDSIVPAAAWAEPAFEGKIAFIKCTMDQGLPPFLQDMFMQRSGVKWIVKEIEASHSPFASKTKEVVEILKGFAAQFGGSNAEG